MATPAQARIVSPARRTLANPLLCLIAGWLVPGAGHLLLRKPIRGVLLLVSILGMFAVGIAIQGKIYTTGTGDLLDILGFVAQLGAGLLFLVTKMFDLGHATVSTAMGDYGTKFVVVAGLLNIVAAIDAHSIASGRKLS
jgi:hypothetical protein